MKDRSLTPPEGYDLQNQRAVGLFAAQLDDQLRRLKEAARGFTPQQLEWQPRPGVNTVGMLLAHIAVAETFWINVAVEEIKLDPDGEGIIERICGIKMDDDGLPLPPDGTHPATLTGKSLDEYFGLLEAARAATHSALRHWNDTDLDRTYKLRDYNVTRAWTLYHVLEHLTTHYGQILLLRHLMIDAGIQPRPARPEDA